MVIYSMLRVVTVATVMNSRTDCSDDFGESNGTNKSLILRICVIFNKILMVVLWPIYVSSLKWKYGDEKLSAKGLEQLDKVQHAMSQSKAQILCGRI